MATNSLPLSPVWDDFRADMPVCEQWAYLDHAAVAPIPQSAQQAIHAWADEAASHGDTVWSGWAQRMERVRVLAASMIGAAADEIALVPNTTTGISLVAEGLPWRAGDNVVILANEFPSNQYPWMNLAARGVETRRVSVDRVAIDPHRIAAACDARTRVVAISWVGYASGWRIDVDEIAEVAHAGGALLMLDAIQGLGVFPLDVALTPIDFLAADGHKWMLGPEGAGLLYVRREHLERLRPLNVGWQSVVQGQDFSTIALNLRPAASRYEGGSQNMVGFTGLEASLDLLARCGLGPRGTAIAERVLAVTDLACERLSQFGAQIHSDRSEPCRSGIVVFDVPGRDPVVLRNRCLQRGVAINTRGGRLRISPHAYNNEEDIDRLIDALQ